MDEPSSAQKERAAEGNAGQGQHTPLGIYGKKQDQSETEVAHRRERYPDDDAERLLNEFLIWIRQEKVPLHGWITALSSIALIFVTISQLVVVYHNNRDTSPLVGYARDQAGASQLNAAAAQQIADASKRNAAAAQSFADTTQKINSGIAQAVGRLQEQADEMEAARETADQNSRQSLQAAKDALHVSERAYVTVGLPTYKESGYIAIPITNSGHVPSGAATVEVVEITFKSPIQGNSYVPVSPLIPAIFTGGLWTKFTVPQISQAPNSSDMSIPIAQFNGTKVNAGEQGFLVTGTITYDDGFPSVPLQSMQFCLHTYFVTFPTPLMFMPCDPAEMIPIAKRTINYPSNYIESAR